MTARFLLHLRRWEHKHTVSDNDDTLEPIEFHQSPAAERSMLSDFGEDPVRRAERDVETRQRARGKARSMDPEVYSLEYEDRGEGSSSMV